MRRLLYIIFLISSGNTIACEQVSMLQLITTPEKYHDKCISTVGVFSLEFERTYIYLDSDSYTYALKENGIYHNFLDQLFENNSEKNIIKFSEAYEGKVMRLKGKFTKFSTGRHWYLDVIDIELIRKATRYPYGK